MGQTVVDALVVTLGLDPSGFTKGQKAAASALLDTRKQAASTASDMEAKGKQAAMFFTRLRAEALTFFAVLTVGSGLKNFIADTITGAASLGRMAPNLRMSTQELSAWQKAAERAGGSAEGMTSQLRESASEVAKYKAGMAGEGVQWFFRFGGNPDALKDGNTYLLARARIIADIYSKDPARAGVVAGQMGISDDQFNLIKQGPAAILALVEAQRKNAVVTAKDAEEAERLRIKLLDLRDTLQSTATRIVLTLAPVLERLLDHFQELAQWIADHRDDIAAWIEDAVKWVGQFTKELDKGVEAVGGWKVVLAGLIALNLVPTITAFVALAAAILGVGKALGVAGTATTAAAAGGGLFALLKRLGVGAALLLHTDSLGEGEQEELARRRAIGDSDPVMTGTRAPMASEGDTQNQVMDSLMAKGWTRAQAAGIAANLKQESNYSPGAVGDGGKAYGIAQWHPDRQRAFRAEYGKDIRGSSLEEQLEFLDFELRNTESGAGDRLKKATNASEAAAVVSKYYERPADTVGEMSRRAQMAPGIEEAERARSAAWAAANAATAQAQSAGAGRGFAQTSTSSTDIQIGKIEVVTQATDADGIAADIGKAVKQNSFVTQANTGAQLKIYDVPFFPGIPPMLRDPKSAAINYAVSFVSPVIGAAQDLAGSVLGELTDLLGLGNDFGAFASGPAPVWGLFNASGEQVLFPDTFLGMEFRNARRISNYPLEQGAFESYNKVNDPFDVVVGMAVGGDVGNRAGFLDACRQLADDLELYTLVTPEEVFESVNVERYDYARKQKDGATLITVNLYLKEIRVNASAEFTTSPETPVSTADAAAATTVATSSAAQASPTLDAADVQNPASASPRSQGQVQALAATARQAAAAVGLPVTLPAGYYQEEDTGLVIAPDGFVDELLSIRVGSTYLGPASAMN